FHTLPQFRFLSVFFFFNHSAPTEIYTLSLHDALPISLAVKRIWEQMPEPKWCIAMGACASSGGMYRSYAVLQGIDQLIPVDDAQDRKSTRLNSSHVEISYAVFCLKKKKKRRSQYN